MKSAVPTQKFEHFYQEHHHWLVGWVKGRLSCPQQANDLAQDTFLKVLLKQNQPQVNKPRAYLSSIARNLIVDNFRRRSIEQSYLDVLALQPEDFAISPEDHNIIISTLLEIDRLLDSMEERTRTIFLMAQIDGLSYVEIAQRLAISTNTVRKHSIRAMSQCLLLIEL